MADTILPPTTPKVANQNTHDEIWGRFKRFYSKNEKTLEKCINTDVKAIANGEKVSDIEQQIDSFSETTKIVLDGLAELGKIHPIIGAAVVAFHAVISLDLARRENDRKVITIMVEMQNMMCAMFQLRHLTHTHVNDNERDQEKSHLDRLVKSITDDITQCGSDINYYLSQKFVLKMAKAWNFEACFKTHVATFAMRRSELQTSITAFIAGGVDHANLTLAGVSTKLDVLESKLDVIFEALLRKLDTPLERETQEFLKANHGIENCLAKDELLTRLLALAGDVVPESEGEGDKRENKVTKNRRILQEELQKDFTDSLKQNTSRFESLLKVQNNNHERVMARFEKQEGIQKDTISKLDQVLFYMHPETKLYDPELRRIWDDMGLKTSVKAKNFVLTFRDHYQPAKSAPLSVHSVPETNPAAEALNKLDQLLNRFGILDSEYADDPNAWLLEYIDVAHVRPIVEAIDTDSSGFISVKEINTFAHSKPTAWSFLQWMAYWAAGWHLNILTYRGKIYDTLIKMQELLPLIHPANQYYVDRYLGSHVMGHIEAMLRSTKDVGADRKSPQLRELALFYACTQEAALTTNLQEMSYIISSPTDANLVAGPTRVEAWIYPLLHLLLERHLAIMTLAKSHILHATEMTTHERSLNQILIVFLQRRDMLQARFLQISQNVAGRFETFAYGIFYASYKEDTEISPAKSTLTKARAKATRQSVILASLMKNEDQDGRLDLSILALGKVSSFDPEPLTIPPPSGTTEEPISHPFEGYWCVACLYAENEVFSPIGLLHFTLSVGSDGTVSGTGESYLSVVELSGHVFQSPTNDSLHDVHLEMPYRPNLLVSIIGVYDAERDVMHGDWESRYSQPVSSAADATGTAQDDIEVDREVLPEDTNPTESLPSQEVDPDGDSDESDMTTDMIGDFSTDANDKASGTRKDSDTSNVPEEAIDTDTDTEDEENIAKELALYSGSLFFTRTSAEVFKYRAHLNSKENASLSNGRRRWIFAIEAVRYQVQAKRFSWDHVRRKFTERKQWVSLTHRHSCSPLAIGSVDILRRLTGEYHPAESRLYSILAHFLHQRLYPYIVSGNGEYCDYCRDDIVVSRFRCITCMKEDLSNQIDLCVDKPACIASPTTNTDHNFVHVPSHTLLRSNYFIHDCDLAALIALCRTRSDDIKRKYRVLEEGEKATNRNPKSSKIGKVIEASQKDESSAVEPMTCVCCVGQVSLPCWVCATCAVDTAICLDCERIQAPVKLTEGGSNSGSHSHRHLLLRIHDNKEIHPREVNNARLQQELSNITADLRSLKEEVTSHLQSTRKVNGVLQALAGSNPNFKLLNLEATDTHGHDDALSDISSDIFTNTDAPLSAPMLPNFVVSSQSPAASEPSAERAVAAGESAASSGNHLEDELVINATPGDMGFEENAITVVNADQLVPPVLPENPLAIMDTPTQVKAQFLNAPRSVSTNAQPSSSLAAADHLQTDHPSTLPRNQGTGIHMKFKALDARLDALDKRMSDMEKATDSRFSGLENQMSEMLALLKKFSQS